MLRISATLAVLLALASCAIPAQKCALDAEADLRKTRNDIKELQATVDRGYGLREITHYVPVQTTCERGSGVHVTRYTCTQYEFRTQEVRYSVDLKKISAELASLKAKLPDVQTQAELAVAQCEATYKPTP